MFSSASDIGLTTCGGTVRRLLLASLPHDLPEISVPKERKVVFIKTTLPLILHANELVQKERQRILRLRDIVFFGGFLDQRQETWLRSELERYDLDDDGQAIGIQAFDALLKRVDIVPPSLALAQAAEESGWGTSRFAREGNALFGQRVYFGKRGLVPKRRDDGESHRVRAFDQLLDGVKAYLMNLNSHFAYKDFRKMRAAMRETGQALDSERLAESLVQYSERREAYVDTIQTIIRSNGFKIFDSAWLGEVVALDTGDPNI